MVEFALVAPLVILAVFMTIDLGRLIYTYNAISSAAVEGARIIALKPQQYSDCLAIQHIEQVGQAFPLKMDPNSYNSGTVNTDPNKSTAPAGPGAPPAGVGWVYIWPAAANATPADGTTAGKPNCAGNTTPRSLPNSGVRDVAVEIQYKFQPLTPIVSNLLTGGITIKTVSIVQTEY
jgi:Flp pilus assembly protein TadG